MIETLVRKRDFLMNLTILYEDNDIIVCEKPSGVPSQSDKGQTADMVSLLKTYIREKEPGKGVPYVAAVHRLDRPVGGVMVYAKTKEAAAGLSCQIQKGQMRKEYLAVICGDFSGEIGNEPKHLCDYLKKDAKTNLSSVTTEKDPQGKKAELAYQVLEVKQETANVQSALSLLNIKLFTGRHHQIRVQLSKHLAGIWGDTKYNKTPVETRGFQQIALYSWRLSFAHPKTKKPMQFEKRPEKFPFSEFETIQKKQA